jgi:hypothetical protein
LQSRAWRGLLIALTSLALASADAVAQDLPTDPQPTAVVPPATFETWFASGTPTTNGVVNPANSITFPNNTALKNVDFYQWSEQMFLWLTSPAPREYGGGGEPIFASPTFFDVSPPDANGNRTFIPHPIGKPPILKLNLRAAQPGAHGLPVVLSKSGVLFEVAPAALGPGLTHVVSGADGRSTPFARVAVERGKATFLNIEGKPIVDAKPVFSPQLSKSRVVQKFVFDNKTIFVILRAM